MDVPLLGQIPVVQSICESGDKGHPSALDDNLAGKAFMDLADQVVEQVDKRNRDIRPTEKVIITN
jgi:ATP-binding protein involved in chromosome partitioning